MGQMLARIVMWGVIIGLVWYLGREYAAHRPNPAHTAAMQEAAQHYRAVREDMDRATGGDVPQISPDN